MKLVKLACLSIPADPSDVDPRFSSSINSDACCNAPLDRLLNNTGGTPSFLLDCCCCFASFAPDPELTRCIKLASTSAPAPPTCRPSIGGPPNVALLAGTGDNFGCSPDAKPASLENRLLLPAPPVVRNAAKGATVAELEAEKGSRSRDSEVCGEVEGESEGETEEEVEVEGTIEWMRGEERIGRWSSRRE